MPPIEQNYPDWLAGYDDARNGRPAEPGPRDRWSYLSGWIAGEAARLAEEDTLRSGDASLP